MSPEVIINVLTIYGPLGMGWIVAYFVWSRAERREELMRERAERREDLLRDVLQNNTATLNVLAERISTIIMRTE